MFKKYKKIIILLSILFFAAGLLRFAPVALAQTASTTPDLGLAPVGSAIGLPATDIRLIVANVIRTALGLLGIVALVLILYGGFVWMTAAGDEEKISQAKKILVNAVIGLAIILSAYSITYFIFRTALGPSASYANPFGYGGTSNATNYGPDPNQYQWYTSP